MSQYGGGDAVVLALGGVVSGEGFTPNVETFIGKTDAQEIEGCAVDSWGTSHIKEMKGPAQM